MDFTILSIKRPVITKKINIQDSSFLTKKSQQIFVDFFINSVYEVEERISRPEATDAKFSVIVPDRRHRAEIKKKCEQKKKREEIEKVNDNQSIKKFANSNKYVTPAW